MTSRRGWQDDATESLHMILHIVDVSVDVSRSSNAQCAVFLSTEQAETYLKIYVLIYHSTYICPSLFSWKENFFKERGGEGDTLTT